MSHTITLQRKVGKRVASDTLKDQVTYIVRRSISGSRGKGWNGKIGAISEPVESGDLWAFEVNVTFKKIKGHKGIEDKQWQAIAKTLIETGQVGQFRQFPWNVISGVDDINEMTVPSSVVLVKDTKNYGSVGTDQANHYKDIYERHHQIKIIHSAIVAAKESDFVNRFHTVLFGPPGCGKTDILLRTGDMLGAENESFMKFDATSTTEAGASRILLEADYIPPVLIVEEIEKTDEKSLRWMLGILDQRAEIRRTNFRIGNKARNVKMLVMATVNDIKLFRTAMSGALASRFPNQVYCPRPSRDILKKILEREVLKVKGNFKWIEPTLEFCFDMMKWDDPRKLVPVCLCGRDALLDGTYQEALKATQLPPESEAKLK